VKKMLFVFMLFMVGCTTPEIKLDPTLTSHRTRYISIVGMENLEVASRIVRIKKQKEGKETIQVPEFVPDNSSLSLNDDTVVVYAIVRVINSKKIPYKIYEVYNMKRTNSEYPYTISHKLYGGSLTYNEFKVYAPANSDVEFVEIYFELRDEKDEVRDKFGHFSVSKTDGEKGGKRNW
jgi:hypothetical protein